MIVGSLLEVMCLDEDGLTARRKKAINRAMADPRTRVGVAYDGSSKDLISKTSALLKPKARKNFQKETAKQMEAQIAKIKNNPAGENQLKDYAQSIGLKYGSPEFEKKLRKDMLTQKDTASLVAAFNPATKTYAANAGNQLSSPIKNGKINWDTASMDHETQHDIQNQVGEKVSKSYGLKPDQATNNWMNNYANLNLVGTDPIETKKYHTDRGEFEANVKGAKRDPKATMSTYNFALQNLGKGKRNSHPTFGSGAAMNNKALLGLDATIQQRKWLNDKTQERIDQMNSEMPNNTKQAPQLNQNDIQRAKQLAQQANDTTLTKKQREQAYRQLYGQYGLNRDTARNMIGAQKQKPFKPRSEEDIAKMSQEEREYYQKQASMRFQPKTKEQQSQMTPEELKKYKFQEKRVQDRATQKDNRAQKIINSVQSPNRTFEMSDLEKYKATRKGTPQVVQQPQPSFGGKPISADQVPPEIRQQVERQKQAGLVNTQAPVQQPVVQQVQPQQVVQQPVQQRPVVQQVPIQPQPQQVVQQPVQTVQPRPVIQQTVTPQPSQPVQAQPAGVVQPRPYANAYNAQLQQRPVIAGGATNRNTGITYYKKNGKLMSTAMQ